ncbi:MAG: hypothetical protein M1820_005735 [Bogoriella megaspora]|nr:MAG: hypothetical protein M1820_005735 [Bogoriella megaspora]
MPRKPEVLQKWFGTDSQEEARRIYTADQDNLGDLSVEECVKLDLPYYAPAETLPAPLPTLKDIENARRTENDLTNWKLGLGDGFVYRVNDVFAVKFGPNHALLQEAENIIFLQQHSKVRTPKLYAAYTHAEGDPLGYCSDNPPRWAARRYSRHELPPFHYLVMEYIEGGSLENKWESLDKEAKINVCTKIGEQLRFLRSIPSSGYYGRVHCQPFNRETSMCQTRYKEPLGPYKTYGDIVTAIADSVEMKTAISKFDPSGEFHYGDQLTLEHFRGDLATLTHYEPKFTHSDLHFLNVMLKPTESKEDGEKEDYEIVLIDWARASWLPAWVEASDILRYTIIKDPVLFAWYVSQAFEPFPHADAVYIKQCGKALGFRMN